MELAFLKRKKGVAEIKLEVKDRKVLELIDKMLESDVEVHVAPVSNEYFVLDRRREVYASIDYSSVKICNHDYRYEVAISGAQSQRYIKKIKDKIEAEVLAIKHELFKNEIGLIDKITKSYDTAENFENIPFELLLGENESDNNTD